MSREDLIRSLIDKDARGLEIGPSYNPIASRALGYRVDIMDHATAAELRAKYDREPNVDCRLIEDVDYVWNDRCLSETVGASGIYDYVVASHVIEHTPDFLGFLNECAKVLTPAGRLVLAVPDMRRCFDAFRPPTGLGGILQAAAEKRTRHSAATACDHIAYMAFLDGRAGWTRNENGHLRPVHDLEFAKMAFERSLTDPAYYDFHAWVFTPSSFRLLLSDLYAMKKTELREVDFRLTDGFEFLSVLAKTGTSPPIERGELLQQIRLELMEMPQVVETELVKGPGTNAHLEIDEAQTSQER